MGKYTVGLRVSRYYPVTTSGFKHATITNTVSSGVYCENKAPISTGLVVQTNLTNA